MPGEIDSTLMKLVHRVFLSTQISIDDDKSIDSNVVSGLISGAHPIVKSGPEGLNGSLFMWNVRNEHVKQSKTPTHYTIGTHLGAIDQSIFRADPNIINELLASVDENGSAVFSGLNDFISQCPATVATGCQDFTNIDDWVSYEQKISVGVNSVGVNVLATELSDLLKTWASVKRRLAHSFKVDKATFAAETDGTSANDNIPVATNALTYYGTALAPIETTTASVGGGLKLNTTASKVLGAFVDTKVYLVKISGKTATQQLPGSEPAEFLITATAAGTASFKYVVNPGTGFLGSPALLPKADYNIEYAVPTAAQMAAANTWSAALITTANAAVATAVTTANGTIPTSLLDTAANASIIYPNDSATTASRIMRVLYTSANVAADTAKLTKLPAPEFITVAGGTHAEFKPENYVSSSVDVAFTLLTKLWKDVSPSVLTSVNGLTYISLIPIRSPGFTANTYLYRNYITSSLLSQLFPAYTSAKMLTFYTTSTVAATNFFQPYYNILTKAQNTENTKYYGFFYILKALGYKIEDVFVNVLTAITAASATDFTVLVAQDLDYVFGDYLKKKPLLERLSSFKTGTQLTPSNVFLLGTDKASDIYDLVYNNSKDSTSKFVKISAQLAGDGQLASSETLYAAAVAQFVQGTLGATYFIKGVVVSGTVTTPAYTADSITFSSPTDGTQATTKNTTGTAVAGGGAAGSGTNPIVTMNAKGAGYSKVGARAAYITSVTGDTGGATPGPLLGAGCVFTVVLSDPNTEFKFGAPDLTYDVLYATNATVAKMMSRMYTLSTVTEFSAGTPAGPNVLDAVAVSGNDLEYVPTRMSIVSKTRPTATYPFTNLENLSKLYQAIAALNGVDIVNIIIAASASTTAVDQDGSSNLIISLVENDKIDIKRILNLASGPWCQSKHPAVSLVDIVKKTQARPVLLHAKNDSLYVSALLDYALVNFSAVSAAVNFDPTILKTLMVAARSDAERSIVLLLMGSTVSAQLATLTTLLAAIKTPQLHLFSYYLHNVVDLKVPNAFEALVENLPEVVVQTVAIAAADFCTASWISLFNSPADLLVIKSFVRPEILASFTRSITIFNANSSVGGIPSTNLVFKPANILTAYAPLTQAELNVLLLEQNIQFA